MTVIARTVPEGLRGLGCGWNNHTGHGHYRSGCPRCAAVAGAIARAVDHYEGAVEALERIANMPPSERNPDGVEQAAASMQAVARAAVKRLGGR